MTTHKNQGVWRCDVCGYVHRGAAPEGDCVVCGAPKEHFIPQVEEQAPSAPAAPRQWKCLICNYVHTGPHPPDVCPVCNAPDKRFEAVIIDTTVTFAAESDSSEHIIIIGGGIAGVSAAESIRQHCPGAQVTLLSKEPHLPYYRLNLTRLLAREVEIDHLAIHPQSWYTENNIQLVLGKAVTRIAIDTGTLETAAGDRYTYDKLILATGSHPFMPPIPGSTMDGVTTLRTLEDARYIMDRAKTARSIVIIGGGVLGLETAGALARHSQKVTLLENFDYLMPRQLNAPASALLRNHVEGLGVQLRVNASVKALIGDEMVGAVQLQDGTTIDADLVIIATGVRSNSFLGRMAGLQVNRGIIVDHCMRTSVPGIFAAGDIAEHRGTVYGLWNAAQFQGSIAGLNGVGKVAEFGGLPRSTSIKVLGVDLLSIGRFKPEDGSDVVIESSSGGNYNFFMFRDAHLAGAILFGNTVISGQLKKAIESGHDFSRLLGANPDALEVFNHIKGLPS